MAEESVDVPPEIVARLRSACLRLPETYEEPAWVGTRWRVRKRTFAHVLKVESGWPPAYDRAAAAGGGSFIVLTFRLPEPERDALTGAGRPYFRPEWAPNIVGLVLGSGVDWDEVAEHLTESYCLLAPRKLVDRVRRPPPG